MTRVFHVSRRPDELAVGQVLPPSGGTEIWRPESLAAAAQMFPEGASAHGLRYAQGTDCTHPIGVSIDTIRQCGRELVSYVVEYTFELVRRVDFPEQPSRYTSLFAVPDLDSFAAWPELLAEGSIVYELECAGPSPLLDAAHLVPGLVAGGSDQTAFRTAFLPDINWESAHRYWSGVASSSPKWELLLHGAITVVRRVGSVAMTNDGPRIMEDRDPTGQSARLGSAHA